MTVNKTIAPAHHRQLSTEQLAMMNKLTELGDEFGKQIELVSEFPDVDLRWFNIGKTQLQQGLMAVKRSIAKPDCF